MGISDAGTLLTLRLTPGNQGPDNIGPERPTNGVACIGIRASGDEGCAHGARLGEVQHTLSRLCQPADVRPGGNKDGHQPRVGQAIQWRATSGVGGRGSGCH